MLVTSWLKSDRKNEEIQILASSSLKKINFGQDQAWNFLKFSRPIPNRLLVISLLGSETNSQKVKILDSKTPPKFQTCHQKISSATSMKSRKFRGLTSRVQNSKLRRSVPVWRKIYSILLIYRILWKLDLNNLYGAWFNIMTQQKVVVNLAFKYTHEVCVQNHANYLKLHYFPRHTWPMWHGSLP